MLLKLLFYIYFIYIMINNLEINIPIFNNFGYGFSLFEPIIFNSYTKLNFVKWVLKDLICI